MSDDAADAKITVTFPDDVIVRRGKSFANALVRHEQALRFGDWYVMQNSSSDAIRDPERNFDVGDTRLGLKIIGGLTFEEARLVALALDDTELDPEDLESEPDALWIVEGILAAALMDHYVFPLSRYLPKETTT